MDSRRSSNGSVSSYAEASAELIRIPINSITITKEKVKNGGRGPTIFKETSKPSRGGSTQTSGRTSPIIAKPPKMMSEAAIKVSASLLSHNDRLRESPDRLGSVFNAEYSNLSGKKKSKLRQPSSTEIPDDELPPRNHLDLSQHPSSPTGMPVTPPTEGLVTPLTGTSVTPPTDQPLLRAAVPTINGQPSTARFSTTHSNGVDHSAEIIELLKKNAQLEGRVEMLSSEADTAIKERAKYQSELGAYTSKLQLLERGQATGGHTASSEELNRVHKVSDDLKRQVAELQRQLTTKSQESSRFSESLHNTQELNGKLQTTITSFGQQLKDKDLQLFNATSKLKSLQSQMTNISDDKQTNLDKISSLQDDVVSLTETKDWYQQQLHSAQELRSNLQSELTRLQNLVSVQADALERVKVENSQLKHQLNDTQHKALTEKQLLIRHLEAIEADMLEREAGFEQLEKEQGLTEYTWQQKMMQLEKERVAMGKLMSESSDLQRELHKTEHDLQAKLAEIGVLETQQEELSKRLTVAQQAEQVTSRELEYTKERLIECETTMNKLQKQDKDRGALLQSLKQEKAAMQSALDSAQEENRAFSRATETLKLNTAKVEQNYRHMKQELSAKVQRVAKLEKENAAMVHKTDSTDSIQAVQHASLPTGHPPGLQEDYAVLQEHMSALRHSYEDAEDRAERLAVEKRTLEHQLTNMKSNAAELEHILQKAHTEKVNLETKLGETLVTLEQQTQLRKSDGNLQQKYNAQQIKVEQAQEAMLKVEASLKERISDHNTSINLLSNQLKAAITERDSSRQQLRSHEESVQASASSQQEHLYAQIQMLRSQLEAIQLQKADLEKQISSYHSGVQSTVKEYQKRLAESATAFSQAQQQLTLERAECETSISRHRAECEANRKVSMELEKERGRLAALKDQHAKVKQHVTDLESALGQRESALVEINAANQSVTRKSDELSEEQRLKVRQLEDDLNNQTNVCDSLQNQLDSERQSEEASKETANSLRLEVECLKQELDKKSLALVSTQSELGTVTEMTERQSTNIAMLNKEYRSAKIELEQLRRSVSENAAKNPIICDELQALHWQVKQKTQESKDAESQLKLCEQRMLIETESIRKALADTKTELDCIKLEMEGVRKEKFSYQSRVAMLRTAVKDLLKQCKVLNSTVAEIQPAAPALPLNESKYEELLKETSAPGYKSKPLENLKSCLSSLHSEISTLQQHMDQHKNAIQTNNESWRNVGTEVADLEKLIHASREATKARSGSNHGQEHVV